jgi:hypothetical protein
MCVVVNIPLEKLSVHSVKDGFCWSVQENCFPYLRAVSPAQLSLQQQYQQQQKQ